MAVTSFKVCVPRLPLIPYVVNVSSDHYLRRDAIEHAPRDEEARAVVLVRRFDTTSGVDRVADGGHAPASRRANDSPWAGMLSLTGTWSSYDNRRLAAIQLYLGCLGPCSQAEHVQTFVHRDLGLADTPRGWGNQLSNKALVNLNYEYRRKLLAPEAAAYAPGRFATDLSLGGSGAAGNLTTRLTGEVELRFGWGLPMGFTKIPDPPGIGMALDPVYIDSQEPSGGWDRWRLFFTVVARMHEITYLAGAEGGPTENGGEFPAFDSYPGRKEVLFGLHGGRLPYSLHLTYYRYLGSALPSGFDSTLDWVNFSFEYRF